MVTCWREQYKVIHSETGDRNSDMIGNCALCQERAKICRSHIIPEWGYTGVYDDKHRFIAFDILNAIQSRIKQMGERERLLCENCEVLLSLWEDYGRRVWDQEVGRWRELPSGGLIGVGLSYLKLRLFLLSVLWRADVAKGDIGENVSLGPHSNVIRAMLLNRDPGPPTLYPCMMMRITEGKTWKRIGLRWPIVGRWDGQRAYSVAFKGVGLLYTIGNARLDRVQQRGCIDPCGRIVMGTSPRESWDGHMGNLTILWPDV